MLKNIFRWLFKSEIIDLYSQIEESKEISKRLEQKEAKIEKILGNVDVSVDVGMYSPSWAVVSIQGQKSDYIKFVDLSQRDMMEIQHFLRRFDRTKVDAAPRERAFLKFDRY